MHTQDLKVPIVGDGHCAMNAMLVQTLITFAYMQHQRKDITEHAVFQALQNQYTGTQSKLQDDIRALLSLLRRDGCLDVKDATGGGITNEKRN